MSSVSMKFREQLKRQLGFLERSCSLYDMGNQEEAIRIATCIRVLVYDSKQSKSISLLTHLNARTINLFTSYLEPPEGENGYVAMTAFAMGVINMGKGGEYGYGPNLDDFSPSSAVLPVDEWWNQIVWSPKLSRRDIVLTAANQDGGAHVDSKVDPKYKSLADDALMDKFIIRKAGKEYYQSFSDMHLMTLRTMGNELLKSPELLRLLR